MSLEVIIGLLKQFDENLNECNEDTIDQAKAILKKVIRFDFIYSLSFMSFITLRCKVLIVQLQDEGINWLDAISLVSSTTSAMQKIRNEEEIQNQLTAAVSMAQKLEIDPGDEYERLHGRRVAPRRLDENRDSEAVQPFDLFYRKEAFAVLDQIIHDRKENWGKILEKIKPFSILKPPLNDLNEKLVEKLPELLSGAVGATSLLAELCVLREECSGAKQSKICPSR